MLKTVERAFKKEKGLILLIQSFRMSKKKDKKNKSLVSKKKNLLEASRKTRALVIIMARTLEEELQGIPCNREVKEV